MAATTNPKITVVRRRDQNLRLTHQDIAKAFPQDSNTLYHTPTISSSASCNERDTVRRALTRTSALVNTLMDWKVLPSSTTIGPSMLSNRKSGTHFPEVIWQRQSGVTARHWLRIQRPVIKQPVPPCAIRFVTGTCLFGKSGAVANLADGSKQSIVSTKLLLRSPIEKLIICDELSFYEVDTACRLSSVIGGMVETLSSSVPVYVHVPVPEYVLFMLGHQQGVVNDVMKEWLDAVEARGAVVRHLFQGLLERESPQLRITLGSPLDDVLMPLLRSAVWGGGQLSITDIVETISSSRTAIGRIFADWLQARKGASVGYYDLAHFGYSAGVVINALASGLAIEVENPSEEPIFRAASRVMRSGWKRGGLEYRGNLMAIYPYEQIVANFETDLEWRRHISGHPEARMLKKLVRQYGDHDVTQMDAVL